MLEVHFKMDNIPLLRSKNEAVRSKAAADLREHVALFDAGDSSLERTLRRRFQQVHQ